MEQVAKLKKTWNLAPVLQTAQKISENYWPCLHLSIGQVWHLNEMFRRYIQKIIQKIYSKMHLASCTNTHRDVTDLVNHCMVNPLMPGDDKKVTYT